MVRAKRRKRTISIFRHCPSVVFGGMLAQWGRSPVSRGHAMFSFKPLSALLCLLCLGLPGRAEKPNDKNAPADGSHSLEYQREMDPDYVPSQRGGKRLDEWKVDLMHPDPSIREAALIVLPQFRKGAENAVPEVVKRLTSDPDASVRVKSAIALRMIPMERKTVHRSRIVRALAQAIAHDTQSIVRYEAVNTFQYFCPINYQDKDEAECITALLTSVNSQTTFALRSVCIDAIILAGVDPKKGPDPRVTMALMQRATSEPATQVRLKAIMALGVMGRPQDPTRFVQVRDLLTARGRATGLHQRTIRIWSHVSLSLLTEKIDDKDLKEIAESLKDREAALRVQAVTALGALQDKAKAHVGTLCDMVLGRRPEDDLGVLKAICSAFASMGNKGDRVKRSLIQMSELDDAKKIEVTLAACNALAQLFTDDGEAMAALEKARGHKSFQDYHRDYIKKFIDDARANKNKPKDKPKVDDKGIGGGVTQPKR